MGLEAIHTSEMPRSFAPHRLKA